MLALDVPENNNQESITQALEGFKLQANGQSNQDFPHCGIRG